MCTICYTLEKGACADFDFEDKCEESATICEAVFWTNGATCNRHCKSRGLMCQEGWDDSGNPGTCSSKLVDDPHKVGDGCGIGYGNQICRCTTEKGKFTSRRVLNYFCMVTFNGRYKFENATSREIKLYSFLRANNTT